MSNEDNDTSGNAQRIEREVLANSLEALSAAAVQQIADSGKWVSAALLTINGGGALAAVGAAAKANVGYSAVAFGVGIVIAIASVGLVGRATYKYIGLISQARVNVLAGGGIELPKQPLITPFTIAALLDALSLLVFIIGAVVLTASGKDTANDARCLAIQSDMLSAKPKRTDDAGLFSALGCHPQGAGSVYAPPVKIIKGY